MGKPATAVKSGSRRRGQVTLAKGTAPSRTFVTALVNFLHRTDELRRTAYEGDLDLAVVGEVVGLNASEPMRRDSKFREKFGDYRVMLGVDGQQPTNALSVAAATGMPRETARRKLKLLEKRGMLVVTKGGYVMKPGFIQSPKNLALADRAMRETVQFINTCFSLGFVQWVEEPAPSRLPARRGRQD
jgi:predicted transcriptional regulator